MDVPAGRVVCRCGAVVPDIPEMRTDHLYVDAVPGCRGAYMDLMALELADARLAEVRMLAVDAYMAQHPGVLGRKAAQSVWVHLVGICLALEFGLDGFATAGAKMAVAAPGVRFEWLEPPASLGSLTVLDVLAVKAPTEHAPAVRRWLEAVWAAWSSAQDVIRERARKVDGAGRR